MSFIGSIEPFSGVKSEFISYIERLEHLFDVNNTLEEKKVSLLITFGGSQLYNTLKSLVAPKTPNEIKYTEIKSVLTITMSLLNWK